MTGVIPSRIELTSLAGAKAGAERYLFMFERDQEYDGCYLLTIPEHRDPRTGPAAQYPEQKDFVEHLLSAYQIEHTPVWFAVWRLHSAESAAEVAALLRQLRDGESDGE